jgi:hypothetical protein
LRYAQVPLNINERRKERQIPHRAGLYFALLQLFFTLSWTVYVIYLPKLAAAAGIPASAVIFLLMLDQAVFTVADFATGIAADRVSKILGRLSYFAAAATLLSCATFLALPFVASAGPVVFIAVTIVWAVTSSALRAPPLMLLGKYAAKPAIPYLSALAMLGYGVAGALAPYLSIHLRDVDPAFPFALSSLALALTAAALGWIERYLAANGKKAPKLAAAPLISLSRPAVVFTLALVVLAFGYQLHFAINSAPAFLRVVPPAQLEWLMPVFWIGFNLAMFPAGAITKRIGAYPVMGASALLGAVAILLTAFAGSVGFLTVSQFIAGAAWGAILMSAFTLAFAIGEDGREGTMTGLLFSALAIATFTRMAMVGSGVIAYPEIKAALQWLPTVCWMIAGLGLLYASVDKLRGANPYGAKT